MNTSIILQVDTVIKGFRKKHLNAEIPKREAIKRPLTDEDKIYNQQLLSRRVTVENVMRSLKIFKILSEKYRNIRKRFTLRLNLIAGSYNYQL